MRSDPGLILVFLASTLVLSCAGYPYKTTITVNRPEDKVRAALARAESKLALTTGSISDPNMGGMLLAVSDLKSHDGATSFSFPIGSFPGRQPLLDIDRRAILQELYVGDGNTLPPMPSEYTKKSEVLSFALFLLNTGWGMDYAMKRNVLSGDEEYRRQSALIKFSGGLDAATFAAAVAGIIGSSLVRDPSTSEALWRVGSLSAVFWAVFKVGTLPIALADGISCRVNNALLDTGYNWDPAFKVEERSDLVYKIDNSQLVERRFSETGASAEDKAQ